jgi:UDP-N-acetylmuramoyl-L-alanyl-D-glutamate--2,6-diaminopimelate ligase
MEPIPGRMEVIDAGQEFRILVDYAHTPDGINEVLSTVRPLVAGRILVVVGAGGDRDQAKRPAMGEAASQADVAFITSDNPRTEDPAEIVAQVSAGAGEAAELVLEPNRRTAIEMAISTAEVGDVVLILGKGHEPGQEIGGRVIPFDDRVVAREAVIGS